MQLWNLGGLVVSLDIIWYMTLVSRELPHLLHLQCHNYCLLWQNQVVKAMVTAHYNEVTVTSPGFWRASTVSLSSYTQSLAQDPIPRDYSKMCAH